MKKKSGIRHRWMVNNVSLMVLLILVAVTAAALAISSYYYSCMQSGLEAKLKTTADFFENYVSSSTEEFYSGVYGFTQSFEEKNTLELEFLSSDGEILCSSFGLAAGTRPRTEDVTGALENLEISVFTGRDPGTGERIMAVSGPVCYSDGQGGCQVTILHPMKDCVNYS